MKVLMCNSVYYLRGGVDRCFFDLSRLLSDHGHQVIPFCMQHPRNYPSDYAHYFVSRIDFPYLLQHQPGLAGRLRVTERVLFSREAQRNIERLIVDTRPDVAHVQQIDHEISPSILPVIRKHGIPIVQTLHDYKWLCPNTNFICRGEVCERCAGGQFYHAVLRRCKRDSRAASLLACLEAYFQRLSRIYERNVSCFLVPGRFLQQRLVDHGFRAPITRLPHPVDVDRFVPLSEEPGEYFLFFGRLVALKGVRTLFEALRYVEQPIQMMVAGEGELEMELREYAAQHSLSNVRFLGHLHTDALIPVVQRAAFTVFPSECYENYPMSIIESFACARPVIASDIGGIPDIVSNGQNGLLFEPGNARQLAERIQYLIDGPQDAVAMGQAGRRQVEAANHPERYYRQIAALYHELLEQHRP
jgi:glycosyltransferase involved in cell wall biosynthesis